MVGEFLISKMKKRRKKEIKKKRGEEKKMWQMAQCASSCRKYEAIVAKPSTLSALMHSSNLAAGRVPFVGTETTKCNRYSVHIGDNVRTQNCTRTYIREYLRKYTYASSLADQGPLLLSLCNVNMYTM